MRQLAIDYGPEIRINVLCPGPVDTPLIWDSAAAFPEPAKAVAAAAERTLLKRLGRPEDVARAALFLASSDSEWMTGSALTLDGGILTGEDGGGAGRGFMACREHRRERCRTHEDSQSDVF